MTSFRVPARHPETALILSYTASGTGSSSAKGSKIKYQGTLNIEQGMIPLYRTGVAGIMYDLTNINLIAMDLVTTDIIEGSSTSIRVLRVLEHRHC